MTGTGNLSRVPDLVPLRPDAPVETPLRDVVDWLGERLAALRPGDGRDVDPVLTGDVTPVSGAQQIGRAHV